MAKHLHHRHHHKKNPSYFLPATPRRRTSYTVTDYATGGMFGGMGNMMTPILLLGGVGLIGYFVYTQYIKQPSTT